MEITRGFKGVWIPKDIWLSDRLSLKEKVLLVEIDSLDRGNGCYAKNKHFADFLELSEKHISRMISHLKNSEMVMVEQKNIKGNTVRTMSTAYAKMRMRGTQKCGGDIRKNAEASISNTMSNTEVYNTGDCDNALDIEYLLKIPQEDIVMLMEKSSATAEQVRSKGEDLHDYCAARNKRYKNYRAFLRNAIKRDYPKTNIRRTQDIIRPTYHI